MTQFHCSIYMHGVEIARSASTETMRELWRAMDTAWQHANQVSERREPMARPGAPSQTSELRKLMITREANTKDYTVDEEGVPGTPPVGRASGRWQDALINWFVANAKDFGFEIDYKDLSTRFPDDDDGAFNRD